MELARATGIWANLVLRLTKQASGVESVVFWSQEFFSMIRNDRFHIKGLLWEATGLAPGQTDARNGRFHIKSLLWGAAWPAHSQPGARTGRIHIKDLLWGAAGPAPGQTEARISRMHIKG